MKTRVLYTPWAGERYQYLIQRWSPDQKEKGGGRWINVGNHAHRELALGGARKLAESDEQIIGEFGSCDESPAAAQPADQ